VATILAAGDVAPADLAMAHGNILSATILHHERFESQMAADCVRAATNDVHINAGLLCVVLVLDLHEHH
jgi:hypothetical protein